MSVFAQAPGPQRPSDAAPQTRQLTEEEAVRLALENNLGIRIARFEPQIEDLGILQARAGYTPTARTSFSSTSTERQSTNVVTGAAGGTFTSDQVQSSLGVEQLLPWGGSYSVAWNNNRAVNNAIGNSFNPQLNSNIQASLQQPLLRGFSIDNVRQQILVSSKNREIADVQLRQSVEATTRTVRNAYWNLAYQIAFLEVQRQSLELAEESLRNTRTRIEIGTTPPIEEVSAEAEVATRREAVIVAEAQIETAQDTLRTLIFDPSMPDFWTIRIEPSALPAFETVTVDVDGAVKKALERRTDLDRSRKSLEISDVNVRYLRNQTLPDITANFDYQSLGTGGTLRRFGPAPVGEQPPLLGETQVSWASTLSTVLKSDYPTWTASLNISYPIGTSQVEANLARERIRITQTQAQLRQQELQVATQVRQAARQLQTNQQRVQTSRASRELAERRLDAEQRKFEAGTSTSFQVFQAQRDLSQARNNELRAILDYNQSKVDFDTVQEVPLTGGGGLTGGAGGANGANGGNGQ